jgi:DNA invertase Pin-like site-specific DNA recombinase
MRVPNGARVVRSNRFRLQLSASSDATWMVGLTEHKCRLSVARFHEALDLTTPSGRALAGMLAVFAEFERDVLRDCVKAGIA